MSLAAFVGIIVIALLALLLIRVSRLRKVQRRNTALEKELARSRSEMNQSEVARRELMKRLDNERLQHSRELEEVRRTSKPEIGARSDEGDAGDKRREGTPGRVPRGGKAQKGLAEPPDSLLKKDRSASETPLDPGEFTRIFSNPQAPSTEPLPRPRRPPDESTVGEFTRISKPQEPSTRLYFSVYCPDLLVRREWTSLLVYLHRSPVETKVLADVKRLLGDTAITSAIGRSRVNVVPRATITVVPVFPDCVVNPPHASVEWLEDWHRVEFRVQPQSGSSAVETFVGTVSVYVGPVLIGEMAVRYSVGDSSPSEREPLISTSTPYQSVFVSYAHEDEEIVRKLEAAAKAFGLIYMRDVSLLKSGEQWMEALVGHIDKADIFQLCWSNNAMKSKYVTQEWKHALDLHRRNFIRPVYWEKPMPHPPRALEDIQFTHLEW